jgi:hypothetical protein
VDGEAKGINACVSSWEEAMAAGMTDECNKEGPGHDVSGEILGKYDVYALAQTMVYVAYHKYPTVFKVGLRQFGAEYPDLNGCETVMKKPVMMGSMLDNDWLRLRKILCKGLLTLKQRPTASEFVQLLKDFKLSWNSTVKS